MDLFYFKVFKHNFFIIKLKIRIRKTELFLSLVVSGPLFLSEYRNSFKWMEKQKVRAREKVRWTLYRCICQCSGWFSSALRVPLWVVTSSAAVVMYCDVRISETKAKGRVTRTGKESEQAWKETPLRPVSTRHPEIVEKISAHIKWGSARVIRQLFLNPTLLINHYSHISTRLYKIIRAATLYIGWLYDTSAGDGLWFQF